MIFSCDWRIRAQEDTVPKLWYTVVFMEDLCAKHWKAVTPTFTPAFICSSQGVWLLRSSANHFSEQVEARLSFDGIDFLRSKPVLNLIGFFPVTSLQNIGLRDMAHYLPSSRAPSPRWEGGREQRGKEEHRGCICVCMWTHSLTTVKVDLLWCAG